MICRKIACHELIKGFKSMSTQLGQFRQGSATDIEALLEDISGPGWDGRYVQMSSGPLNSWYAMVDLPEISIHWYRHGAAIHAQESHSHSAVFFTFVIDAADYPRWHGRMFDEDMALMFFPGQEQDYLTPRRMRSLGLMIQKSLIERMGWEFNEHACLRQDRRKLIALKNWCQRFSRRAFRLGPDSREYLEVAQERLAILLDDVLKPWLSGDKKPESRIVLPARSYPIVRRGIELIEEWPAGEKLDIGILAREIPAHRRTLHRAFQDHLGMGPYEYYLISRLHVFRALVAGKKYRPGLITEAATKAGFTHMGRFSGQYYKHFSEKPRDTLRRWAGIPGGADTD